MFNYNFFFDYLELLYRDGCHILLYYFCDVRNVNRVYVYFELSYFHWSINWFLGDLKFCDVLDHFNDFLFFFHYFFEYWYIDGFFFNLNLILFEDDFLGDWL